MSFSPSSSGLSGPMSAVAGSIGGQREGAFAQLATTFMTRLPAAPLPAPYVVGFSAETAALLGFDATLAQDPTFAEFFSGNTTRDWPAQAQGQRPHAVFADGRRSRGAALVDPRISLLGSDAPPRHSDDARTLRDRLRSSSATRGNRNGGGRDARRAELRALRAFRALLFERSRRCAALAGRSRDRPLLSADQGSRRSVSGAAERSGAVDGRPARAMAGRRLLPRRDEHRQHVDPRSHDRLRPVRLHGCVRCELHLQPFGYAGPLRVPDAAADCLLEPLLPRARAAAAPRPAARRRGARRTRGRRRATRARRLQGPLRARARSADARQARPRNRTSWRRSAGESSV